jgi:hypothetical protein
VVGAGAEELLARAGLDRVNQGKGIIFQQDIFRYVMEQTDHTFVVGAGAEELLDRAGLDRVNLF